MLLDNHGRSITYLRLAVTDRCNLRCFYCMPPSGMPYLPKKELLTFEEIERLVRLTAALGIRKVRITGGEPFLRRDLMQLLARIHEVDGIQSLHITTNGTLTAPFVRELKAIGISSVNLSLDTLDRERFKAIALRDDFDQAHRTLQLLLEQAIPVNINTVVMPGKNTEDIVALAELARTRNISVRFIEEMPFNGGAHPAPLLWSHQRILDHLKDSFPDLRKVEDAAGSTAFHYTSPGFQGTIGIIAAYTRNFCGTCNRLRITAQGMVKTCLYGAGTLDLKSAMRNGASDEQLKELLIRVNLERARDGFEAEAKRENGRGSIYESMSAIGG